MPKKKTPKKKLKIKHKPKPKSKPKAKATPKPKMSPMNMLIAGCKTWDNGTTKAHKGEYKMPEAIARYYVSPNHFSPYSAADYSNLQCRIAGKQAEVTVGSSENHKAKIDLEKKTFDYYDWSKPRFDVMMDVFKDVRLKCALNYNNDTGRGVAHCTEITPAKLKNVFRALIIPTSMDFRKAHCTSDHTIQDCRKAELKFFRDGPKKEK